MNTEPAVGLIFHDQAVQQLGGRALALEAVKQKVVEKARRAEHCRLSLLPTSPS
jgi:hypothetical protein